MRESASKATAAAALATWAIPDGLGGLAGVLDVPDPIAGAITKGEPGLPQAYPSFEPDDPSSCELDKQTESPPERRS